MAERRPAGRSQRVWQRRLCLPVPGHVGENLPHVQLLERMVRWRTVMVAYKILGILDCISGMLFRRVLEIATFLGWIYTDSCELAVSCCFTVSFHYSLWCFFFFFVFSLSRSIFSIFFSIAFYFGFVYLYSAIGPEWIEGSDTGEYDFYDVPQNMFQVPTFWLVAALVRERNLSQCWSNAWKLEYERKSGVQRKRL